MGILNKIFKGNRYTYDSGYKATTVNVPAKKKKPLRYSDWSQADKYKKAMEDAYENTTNYGLKNK